MKPSRPCLLLVSAFFSFHLAMAKPHHDDHASPDSLLAASYVDSAIGSAWTNRDSSFYWLEKAFLLFKKNDDLRSWIKACKDTGAEFDYAGDPQTALFLYEWPLQARRFRSPASPQDWRVMGWLYTDWGYTLARSMGKYYEARAKYEEARRIFEEKANLVDVDVVTYVHRELGNICTRLGDYEAALLLLEQAKRTALQAAHYNLAAEVTSDICLVHINNGQDSLALKGSLAALAYPSLNEISVGLLQLTNAQALVNLKQPDKALLHLRKAQSSLEVVVRGEMHPSGKYWLSQTHELLCEITPSDQDAEQQYRQSMALLAECYPDTLRREFSKVRLSMARRLQRQRAYAEALRLQQAALAGVLYRFREEDPMKNPAPADFYPENTIGEALGGKAAALEALYLARHERCLLEKSIECHDLIFRAEQVYRQVHHFESSKLAVVAESSSRTESALGAVWRFYQDFAEEKELEKAFSFAEKSKSVLLYEALRQSGASSVANVPDSLLQMERQIKEKLTDLEKAVFFEKQRKPNAANPSNLVRMEQEILAGKTALSSLHQGIAQDFPAFFNLKQQVSTAAIAEVQHLLSNDQALLEYFVGDSSLYVFTVKKAGFQVERLPKDFPLEEWVTAFRQGIEAFQFSGNDREKLCEAYTQLAQQLYQKLLQPLEKQGLPKKLIIVPGGILAFLPFDALLYEAPPAPCAFRKYPYLARRHVISYDYSATLFKELMQPGKAKASRDFAGFAPAFEGGGPSGFGRLAFNIAGAAEASRIWHGTPFLREAANSQAFRENAALHRILYLATHAKANTDEGDFSFVVLAGEGGGYDTMFVKDIYNLRLCADLVFLGACETGSGKFHNGEGIISLARSFFYAGAKSIVTTLWSINDESNKDLTIRFFEHLHEGERKDEALWHAKLEQLDQSPNDLYAHPVYWAAYTPIGNMEPIRPQGSVPTEAWWLAGGGLAAAAIFLLKKKKKTDEVPA